MLLSLFEYRKFRGLLPFSGVMLIVADSSLMSIREVNIYCSMLLSKGIEPNEINKIISNARDKLKKLK